MRVSSSLLRSRIAMGFQFGKVQVTRDGHSYESPGIVMVNCDGTFARMGVRPGDMPFAFHGNGTAAMY